MQATIKLENMADRIISVDERWTIELDFPLGINNRGPGFIEDVADTQEVSAYSIVLLQTGSHPPVTH